MADPGEPRDTPTLDGRVRGHPTSLLGSRSGGRRVPALWISHKPPTLGWCWEGNPHTWLGVASASGRQATPPRS
nr:DUF5701 family protein [Streptomyces bicolor]